MMTITPTIEELQILKNLRAHRREHRKALPKKLEVLVEIMSSQYTLGQRISDGVAKTVGSWKFIIIQSVCIMIWIMYNALSPSHVWDPYPFILLNLMLSFQAAYTAPAIMMSQNRLSEIDLIKEKELYALSKAIEALSLKLDSRGN